MSLPATDWETQIESQAGNASSSGQRLSSGASAAVSFMRPRTDGNDAVVTVGYKIAGEVRLAAIDGEDNVLVGKSSGGTSVGGFSMREVRFANVKPSDLKKWQLQTRQRKTETVEFRNVSLHRGKVTDVKTAFVKNQSAQQSPQRAVISYSRIAMPGTVLDGDAATKATSPAPEQLEESRQAFERQQELVNQLAKQHGYRLETNELLKRLGEPLPKPRLELQQLLDSQPGYGETPQPFAILFQSTVDGGTQLASWRVSATTLEGVLEQVLDLKRHQIECDVDVLKTPITGDWVCSWDPRKFRVPTHEEVAALETVLNEQLLTQLSLEWKPTEQQALVVKGDYKFTPVAGTNGKLQVVEGRVAERADGTFQFPVRRSSTTGAVGSFPQFLQAIGEVVGLPTVDEIDEHPTKQDFFWRYSDNFIAANETLEQQQEKDVLDSISKQTGFELVKEKRPVYKLIIKTAR